MADWSITKAQYERNCFSKPLLNGRYEFILNRYAWREYDWMPLSLKSIFYNTSGSFYDNNEPLYSCLETWMTRMAHSQRGGSLWLWLECIGQEYLVNPQTTGFVLREKTSLGTRKCTFVRFKEASVLADLLRSVWVWKGGFFYRCGGVTLVWLYVRALACSQIGGTNPIWDFLLVTAQGPLRRVFPKNELEEREEVQARLYYIFLVASKYLMVRFYCFRGGSYCCFTCGWANKRLGRNSFVCDSYPMASKKAGYWPFLGNSFLFLEYIRKPLRGVCGWKTG
jgi:hypothetical protein